MSPAVLAGDPAPGTGGGTILGISGGFVPLNDLGNVAFGALLVGGATDHGLFLATPVVSVPVFGCQGFEPPLDEGPVTVKKNRVLPLKARLADADGLLVTSADITALPVISVFFDDNIAPSPIDVTTDALSAGQGTDGNQFTFDGSKWAFNLKTKNYTASGTYTITMVSGDSAEYVVSPTCMATFVIE